MIEDERTFRDNRFLVSMVNYILDEDACLAAPYSF